MPQTRVYGTENADNVRAGGDGTSIYYGLAGNDTIIGTDADLDVIFGGDGNDSLMGATGDFVIGGAGNDTLSGTYVSGGAGNDYITASNFVQFSGTRSSYSVTSYGSGASAVSYVYDNRSGSPDGYDTIVGAANLTFSDTSDFTGTSVTVPDTQKMTVYRFYNNQTQTHFYTTNTTEVNFIQQNLPSFAYEGPRFNVPTSTSAANAKPMYRFYNTVSESHFFTFDEGERDFIISSLPDFSFEGVGLYGYTNNAVDGCEEMYRFYNEATGRHFFTTSEEERDFVIQNLASYRFEGLAGWVFA